MQAEQISALLMRLNRVHSGYPSMTQFALPPWIKPLKQLFGDPQDGIRFPHGIKM
jgi:hypothetical protein